MKRADENEKYVTDKISFSLSGQPLRISLFDRFNGEYLGEA